MYQAEAQAKSEPLLIEFIRSGQEGKPEQLHFISKKQEEPSTRKIPFTGMKHPELRKKSMRPSPFMRRLVLSILLSSLIDLKLH